MMFLAPITLLYFGFQLPKLTLKPKLIKSLLLGVGSGFAISVIIIAVFAIFHSTFLSFAGNIKGEAESFGIIRYYIPLAIVFSLFHSLFEEYFWRWYVVRGLEIKLSSNYAILLGAALFATHHYIVLSQFFNLGITILFGTLVGVGGYIWSRIYKRTGSLLGPWISHAVVNAVLFVIGFGLLQ